MGERTRWRQAAYGLLVVSLVVGVIQRTRFRFLDPLFEFFIFHLSTIVAFVIYSQAPQE